MIGIWETRRTWQIRVTICPRRDTHTNSALFWADSTAASHGFINCPVHPSSPSLSHNWRFTIWLALFIEKHARFSMFETVFDYPTCVYVYPEQNLYSRYITKIWGHLSCRSSLTTQSTSVSNKRGTGGRDELMGKGVQTINLVFSICQIIVLIHNFFHFTITSNRLRIFGVGLGDTVTLVS